MHTSHLYARRARPSRRRSSPSDPQLQTIEGLRTAVSSEQAAGGFTAALADLRGEWCPGECDCAKNRLLLRNKQDDRFCRSASVNEYLRLVYPTAAAFLLSFDSQFRSAALFRSLQIVYDHGCGIRSCGESGGALLRWLYSDLLPCRQQSSRSNDGAARTSSSGSCLEAHAQYSPRWASNLLKTGWLEVEHRAFGLGIPAEALPGEARKAPTGASDFLDAGVAGMWYAVRRGSGIFYHLGEKTAVAPGKNAMVAKLLHELALRGSKELDDAWRALAESSGLFRSVSRPTDAWLGAGRPHSPYLANKSAGSLLDAERIRATAHGSVTCTQVLLRHCRCRYLLDDRWDGAMVWLARALGYQTLLFTATLLSRHPCSHVDPNSDKVVEEAIPEFVAAYPELVDVRPLTGLAWDPLHDPTASLLTRDARQATSLGVFTQRKVENIANSWITSMRRTSRLTLRDPFNVADDSRAWPCNFSVHDRLLGCASHISTAWPRSGYKRCGLVMCGEHGLWVGGREATHAPWNSSKEALVVEDIRSYLASSHGVYPTSRRLAQADPPTLIRLFDSLGFYYKLGGRQQPPREAIEWRSYPLAARAEPPRQPLDLSPRHNCFQPPGRLGAMRDRFAGLLPCRAGMGVGDCLERSTRFAPSWLESVRSATWLEVAHMALGDKPSRGGDSVSAQMSWEGFLDPGGASLWFHYLRGSGIWLRVGRMFVAASKNEALAGLLDELPDGQWPPTSFVRAGFCATASAQACASAQELAIRVRAAGRGQKTCVELGLNLCRLEHVLGDDWDTVLIWLGRAAHYETLFLYAPLLTTNTSGDPLSMCGVSEIVDLRVPAEVAALDSESRAGERVLAIHSGPPRRKPAPLSKVWAESMQHSNLLSLRDPLNLDDDRSASPCRFGPSRLLACDGHISARLEASLRVR